ncbi:alpha/beta fold hydrolase, partial [candidate division KSB1 bacterium]|nr:alpha/beta fold hydrolase [candidate division KSB1 bacterium]NIR71662.1 alpha/beta fold hydrolase [candidate division KSB1 bacterium]NIS26374.1 alpha/beta fold hydrolase [candidate division KSB1 bacterium]NIT73133.1 alpha/beta fold hydrolase [candidate division KSB1 bacterium]NIU27060.1 alpha/beta fold hydrolase [candidate division KSB1 bacterium]
IYYLPQNHPARGSGIVLCYPMGQEYMWMHRAYRQLAMLFSRAGFHVLRFDYYGCGDSGGDTEEGDVTQWLEDISTAIEEIKDSSGLDSVTLVGFRLGATLSVLAGSQRNDVDNVVLWDPVVNGRSYVEELLQMHRAWAENNLPDPGYASENNGSLEIMGFPLTNRLRGDLEKINLLKIEQRIADQVCFVESGKASDVSVVRHHLKKLSNRVDYNHIPGSKEWIRSAGLNPLAVPNQILQSIVSWVTEVNA